MNNVAAAGNLSTHRCQPFRFLRNIPPFRWLNSAKIKKLRNANTTNKDYSGAGRCIMPNISQRLNILLLVTALVIGWRVACWSISSLETKALLYLWYFQREMKFNKTPPICCTHLDPRKSTRKGKILTFEKH